MHRPIAALVVASFATVVAAQEEGLPPVVDQGPSVYVRDSGVAAERLSLAERLERQKEWGKAADVYQDIVGKFADRLIASKKDDRGQAIQYVSAARVVQDRLAKWPAEGVAAYRHRFEETARDLLASDDPSAASKLRTLYFVTDAGRDAAIRDLSSAFERGDFTAAAAVGRHLLDAHPNIEAQRPALLLQTGLAEHMAGQQAEANQRLEELKAKFADAPIRAGGVDGKAAELLETQLASLTPTRSTFQAEDWPVPFGTPSADAVPAQVSLGGAKLFSVELPSPRPRGVNGDQARVLLKQTAEQRRLGTLSGILPAVEGNALFFQDNARVWAVDLSSGQSLPGWEQTYGQRRGYFAIDALPTPMSRQMTVSVVADRVVALLGQFNPTSPLATGYSTTSPQLVCLDRSTGRKIWGLSANDPKLPPALRDGYFYGSPVVDSSTVYTLLTTNRGQQFDECHLAAFSLTDGSLRWTTYVASTSNGDPNFVGDSMSVPPAALSLANGRLFVLTNLGALACIDGSDGRTQWLNIYAQNKPANADPRRMIRPPVTVEKPFAIGPPIISGGYVFVLPADANAVLIYDAANGSVVRELPRTLDERQKPVRSIVGVLGDTLVLANRATLFRLPWRTFDPTKSLIANGGMYKSIAPEEGDDTTPPDSIRGRPFLTDKSILVTTSERLYRIALNSFKIDAVYPEQGKWDADESAGNIIATGENLVIAGPSRVTVYADLSVATAKLDQRLAADPKDVDASLRYAELLLAAGQAKNGVARMDEAAANLGGMASLTPGGFRDRLFDAALGYAIKLKHVDANATFVDGLFDRAAAAANSPVQQVRWRVAKAQQLRQRIDPAGEAALHQQILSRADWRSVPAAGQAGPTTAGADAAAAVTELIRLNGPWVYAPYEAEADEAYAKVGQAQPVNPDALLAIVDQFPASRICSDLLSTAAERFEAEHQPRRATQTLRRLLKRDLPNDRRQSALQALARNYLAVPDQAAIAQVRLRQAKAIAPEATLVAPLTLPDGQTLSATTVSQAIPLVDAYRLQTQQRLLPVLGAKRTTDPKNIGKPAFAAPQVVADAFNLVDQQADVVRNDRVVLYGTDRRIGFVTGDSGQVQWTQASTANPPVGCGFVGDTLIIIGLNEVMATGPDGKLLWKTPLSSLPTIDAAPAEAPTEISPKDEDDVFPPNAVVQIPLNRRFGRRFGRMPMRADQRVNDPAFSGERVVQFRLLSDRVVIGTSSGRIAAMDVSTGTALWQNRGSEITPSRVLSNDDFVAISYVDPPSGSSVQVFDAVTGQSVLSKTYDGNNPQQAMGGLVNIALSPDGVLVTMLAGQLIGVDLYDIGSGEWKRDRPNGNSIEMPFITSPGEGQLVISGDRVLAVYRAPGGQQSVHAYALRTLKPMTMPDPRNKQPVENLFAVRKGNELEGNPLSILASGSKLYVCGTQSASAYDLDHPDQQGWDTATGAGYGPTRDYVLAQDYFVQIVQPSSQNPAAQALPAVQLALYGRSPAPSGAEAGVLEQRVTFRDLATLMPGEWQVANGGFYFLTNDRKLKVARVNP